MILTPFVEGPVRREDLVGLATEEKFVGLTEGFTHHLAQDVV